MATLVVFVLRDRTGIHPASAVSLCAARDLADQRGATVTALALGDAGDLDHIVTQKAGTYGADQLLFVGPADLPAVATRFAPRYVLVPNTPEGNTVLGQLRVSPGESQSVIFHGAQPLGNGSEYRGKGLLVTAGTLPWHACTDTIEPDYGGAFEDGIPSPWVTATPTEPQQRRWLALKSDRALDAEKLDQLAVERVEDSQIAQLEHGTLLVSTSAIAQHDTILRERHRSLKLVWIEDQTPPTGPAVELAVDFALVGPPTNVLDELKEPSWSAALD